MKIYLAAPIFTRPQLIVVSYLRDLALRRGHIVFSPYHNSADIFKGRAPKDCSPEERAQVLEDNIKNIEWCEVMLAWVGGMGGFTDPGVVWEMGYARASDKFTLAYLDRLLDRERQSMNLMLSGTIDAICRSHIEISQALTLLISRQLPEVRRIFSTDVLGEEKEPVV